MELLDSQPVPEVPERIQLTHPRKTAHDSASLYLPVTYLVDEGVMIYIASGDHNQITGDEVTNK